MSDISRRVHQSLLEQGFSFSLQQVNNGIDHILEKNKIDAGLHKILPDQYEELFCIKNVLNSLLILSLKSFYGSVFIFECWVDDSDVDVTETQIGLRKRFIAELNNLGQGELNADYLEETLAHIERLKSYINSSHSLMLKDNNFVSYKKTALDLLKLGAETVSLSIYFASPVNQKGLWNVLLGKSLNNVHLEILTKKYHEVLEVHKIVNEHLAQEYSTENTPCAII